MAKGVMKEVGSEIGKVLFDEDYAPERMRVWNFAWYLSMLTACSSKRPVVRALGYIGGLYSTWQQQSAMGAWMRNVSDKLNDMRY